MHCRTLSSIPGLPSTRSSVATPSPLVETTTNMPRYCPVSPGGKLSWVEKTLLWGIPGNSPAAHRALGPKPEASASRDSVMLFPDPLLHAGLQTPPASLGTVTFSLTTFGHHVTNQLLSLCKQLPGSCPDVGAERSPGTEKLFLSLAVSVVVLEVNWTLR